MLTCINYLTFFQSILVLNWHVKICSGLVCDCLTWLSIPVCVCGRLSWHRGLAGIQRQQAHMGLFTHRGLLNTAASKDEKRTQGKKNDKRHFPKPLSTLSRGVRWDERYANLSTAHSAIHTQIHHTQRADIHTHTSHTEYKQTPTPSILRDTH